MLKQKQGIHCVKDIFSVIKSEQKTTTKKLMHLYPDVKSYDDSSGDEDEEDDNITTGDVVWGMCGRT